MAYENGSNIFNYAVSVFEKYKSDNMIFTKALQTIQFYQGRTDFPYCFSELKTAVDKVIGGSFLTFFHHGYIFLNAESAEDWNPTKSYDPGLEKDIDLVKGMNEDAIKRLVRNYKDDIQAFILTIEPLGEFVFGHSVDKRGLKTIAFDKNDEDTIEIKIIRNDNESLELSVSNDAISFMISQLASICGQG